MHRGFVGTSDMEMEHVSVHVPVSVLCILCTQCLLCLHTAFSICLLRAPWKPYFPLSFSSNCLLDLKASKRKVCQSELPGGDRLLPRSKRKKS